MKHRAIVIISAALVLGSVFSIFAVMASVALSPERYDVCTDSLIECLESGEEGVSEFLHCSVKNVSCVVSRFDFSFGQNKSVAAAPGLHISESPQDVSTPASEGTDGKAAPKAENAGGS